MLIKVCLFKKERKTTTFIPQRSQVSRLRKTEFYSFLLHKRLLFTMKGFLFGNSGSGSDSFSDTAHGLDTLKMP